MAQGAQQGANKNGDLLDTLNEYSVQFSAMGMSAEEFTGVLIDGAKNGAFSIDKVGDAVKEFTIRSKDGSKTSVSAFEQLGFNADQMTKSFAAGGETARQAFDQVVDAIAAIEDPVAKNSIGVSLFGTQFEDLEAGAISALGNIQSQTDMAAGTLEQISNVKGDSLGSQFKSIGRQLNADFFIPLGEKLMPKLEELSKWITDNSDQISGVLGGAVNTLAGFFNALLESLTFVIDNYKIFLPILTGVTAAIIAQFVIGTLIPMYQAWRAATVGMTLAQAAFNAVMALNPFTWVALAIGAVIAAIVAIIFYWDEIKAAAKATWDWISSFFKTKLGFIVALFGGPITIGLLIISNWKTIKKWALIIWDAVAKFFIKVGKKIKDAFFAVRDGFLNAFKKIKSFAMSVFTWMMNFFRSRIGKIVAILGGPITVGLMIIANWKKIKRWALVIWGAIKTFFTNTVTNIKDKVVSIFGSMASSVRKRFKKVKDWVVEIAGNLRDRVKGIFDKIKETIGGIWSSAKDKVKTAFDWVEEAVKKAIRKIRKIFVGFKTFFKNIFDSLKGLMKVPLNGIIDIFNKFIGFFEKALNTVVDGINKLTSVKIAGKSIGLDPIPTFDFKDIPQLAEGGTVLRAGTTLVGEEGPELLNLPRGAEVRPLDKVGDQVINININDAKILNNRDASLLAERIVSVLKLNGIKPRGV
jgi:hypothetical protein